jgi:hypothetical protein
MAKFQKARCWRNADQQYVPFIWENSKWSATLETSLVVSYKTKHDLIKQSQNCASW